MLEFVLTRLPLANGHFATLDVRTSGIISTSLTSTILVPLQTCKQTIGTNIVHAQDEI